MDGKNSMNDQDVKLLERSFKRYYLSHLTEIPVPTDIAKREFGYKKFTGGMIRHMNVQDEKAMRLLLVENSPADVYCSNSYYLFPNMDMKKKDWQGADLIFDIDAKDLHLDCRYSHTCRVCGECKNVYKESSKCPQCNSIKHISSSWPCKNCINAAKKQVVKLVDILENDLGICADLIEIYFSGNEGFHVHVGKTEYNMLEPRARVALGDYIRFYNVMPETYGVRRSKIDRKKFPTEDDPGWHGRVAKKFFGKNAPRSTSNTEYVKIAEKLKNAQYTMGACIDMQVTGDIHRIFRMPGSLNSKSGLAKILCTDLAKFDPYQDACFIDCDLVKISAQCPIRFSLGGRTYGPYIKETKVEVERFAAVYMMCKGTAHAISS
ncbi:MAG: DNA primase small subunit [Cenarchaeum symbiont of Oopsacas minuta]|nr:DNA primase small subunit [Cenarchaeum symbiont of Oopsacas minuta]